ncbi:hypothetical protein GLW08_06890 [Pontibacillus yanchengensis]|uniref:Uncharacterized protein n=2 Tax=Pontibacillus yanchengensis TaxID=462910 RepID=A0ACC7VDL7_9BACI|nr:YhcN/YlaJ family sporulation lipoprotein [Pontibacillus yanchengensis]MYL32482.1 hypothetical protein [Pontibacillus yanchengensis]MYL53063.1 hypothetical protein [Pontibacillus yanchengensis]
MNIKIAGITMLSAAILFGCQGDDKEARMGTKGNDYEDSANNTNYSAQEDDYNKVDYDNGPNQGMMDGQDYGEENVGNEDTYKNDKNDNNQRYNVAREVAQKISKQVEEVDRAYVLKTRNNAYVAVTLDGEKNNKNNAMNNNNNNYNTNQMNTNDNNNMNNNDTKNNMGNDKVNDSLKSEIAKVVKSSDKEIDNVYVSSNPDFYGMTRGYVNDVNDGNPVGGFFNEFGKMVDRIFPDAR